MLHSNIFCWEIQEPGMELNLNYEEEGCQFSLSPTADSLPARLPYVTPCPFPPPASNALQPFKGTAMWKETFQFGSQAESASQFFFVKHLWWTHNTTVNRFSPSKVGKLGSTQNNFKTLKTAACEAAATPRVTPLSPRTYVAARSSACHSPLHCAYLRRFTIRSESKVRGGGDQFSSPNYS